MATKQPKRRRKLYGSKPPILTQKQAEDIKRAFDRALAAGDPLAVLAHRIAQGEDVATLTGEPLNTPMIDTAAALETGIRLPREADYFLDPQSGAVRPVEATTEPALVMDGIEVHPERLVRNWVRVGGVPCPQCNNNHTKVGWALIAPDTPHGLLLVQCGGCGVYLWIGRGQQEGQAENEQ